MNTYDISQKMMADFEFNGKLDSLVVGIRIVGYIQREIKWFVQPCFGMCWKDYSIWSPVFFSVHIIAISIQNCIMIGLLFAVSIQQSSLLWNRLQLLAATLGTDMSGDMLRIM